MTHFSHANAYPPGSYQQLLQSFAKQYQVLAIQHRPLWEGHSPAELTSWQLIADDLIRFLDQQGLKDIIGVGHSMGGVATLLAAHQRPDLFKKLILIEPVMLPPSVLYLGKIIPLALRKRIIPIAKQALRRRFQWPDQTAMFEHFRAKKVFRRLTDEALWDYVSAGSTPTQEGNIRLAYSREWEAQVYCYAPSYRTLRHNISIPTLAIRGQKTDAIDQSEWELWRKSGTAKLVTIKDAGHLLPMEQPELVSKLIVDWLAAD